MTQTILFDLDGTLTNPALGIVACLQHALHQLGHGQWHDHDLLRFIGPPLTRTFAELLQTEDAELVGTAVRLYRERFGAVGIYENELYVGIPELLARLKQRRLRLFVATSKPTVYSERIIEHFGLAPYFERTYGSELTGERADKAALIRYILDAEGLLAETTWMVGDRSHDVIGASACGVSTFGVLWGFGSREELQDAGALAVIETIAELEGVLSRLHAVN